MDLSLYTGKVYLHEIIFNNCSMKQIINQRTCVMTRIYSLHFESVQFDIIGESFIEYAYSLHILVITKCAISRIIRTFLLQCSDSINRLIMGVLPPNTTSHDVLPVIIQLNQLEHLELIGSSTNSKFIAASNFSRIRYLTHLYLHNFGIEIRVFQ